MNIYCNNNNKRKCICDLDVCFFLFLFVYPCTKHKRRQQKTRKDNLAVKLHMYLRDIKLVRFGECEYHLLKIYAMLEMEND